MSGALAERVLMAHLSHPDSMAVIVDEGLPKEAVPTEVFRDLYTFAIEYYVACGRTKAPSTDVLQQEFPAEILEHDLVLTDPTDSVEWAIGTLRGAWASQQAQEFCRGMAHELADASQSSDPMAVIDTVSEQATKLITLSIDLAPKDEKVSLQEAAAEIRASFEERLRGNHDTRGLAFGLPNIDTHTYRIHPGELAILAGGAKVGKSWFMDHVALREWMAGKTIVLYTLENSVEMTLNRIACLATHVNGWAFERGLSNPEEQKVVHEWLDWLKQRDEPHLWVLQPQADKRSPQHLVREAIALGADAVLIDQLGNIEPPDYSRRTNERFKDVMSDLREMITGARTRLPCMVAHQLNRTGVEEAQKVGRVEMWHMAESADIERICDFAFAMFQLPDMRPGQRMFLKLLAARRVYPTDWLLVWDIAKGVIKET